MQTRDIKVIHSSEVFDLFPEAFYDAIWDGDYLSVYCPDAVTTLIDPGLLYGALRDCWEAGTFADADGDGEEVVNWGEWPTEVDTLSEMKDCLIAFDM